MILHEFLYKKLNNNYKIIPNNYDYYNKITKDFPKQFRIGQVITIAGLSPIAFLALNIGITGSWNLPQNIAIPLMMAEIPIVIYGQYLMLESIDDYAKYKHAKFVLKKFKPKTRENI